MAAAGVSWRVEVADDPASWDRLRGPVQQVYDAAEEAHPRQHLMQGRTGEFTADFVTRAVARGEALVITGCADDHPVCFDIVLTTPTTWSWWVGRFEPTAASVSPGHLLLRAGLLLAAGRGVSRIDLLLGDAEYKRRWTTGSYSTHDVMSGRRVAVAAVSTFVRCAELRRRLPRSAPTARRLPDVDRPKH
jgi:CelD/BcsL family acetyltransferase involved in cellulose biosynthesis